MNCDSVPRTSYDGHTAPQLLLFTVMNQGDCSHESLPVMHQCSAIETRGGGEWGDGRHKTETPITLGIHLRCCGVITPRLRAFGLRLRPLTS